MRASATASGSLPWRSRRESSPYSTIDLGEREAGLVGAEAQEPVHLVELDGTLHPTAGALHDPAAADRPELAGVPHQTKRGGGLPRQLDERVGLIHGHEGGLVDDDH